MQESQGKAPASEVFSGVITRNAIEDMAGAIRQFYDLEAEQLEPGSCRCQIDFIAAGQTFLYREHYPLRTRMVGELLGNRFGLAVPLCGPESKFSGELVGPSQLPSAMTGEEIELVAAGGFKHLVVLLDHERLIQAAEQAGMPREVQSSLRRGRTGMPLAAKPQAVAAFARRVQHLLRQAAAGELQITADQFEEWVHGQTLSILDVKEQPMGRPPGAALVRRAIEIADDYPGPAPVATLCRLLRVSPGTLENAFKTATGVTPHAFFLRRRLNRARNVLLREDPKQRGVTDIASELGFSELGRFAVRYRQMFGESPSETLRRRVTAGVRLEAGIL